MVFRSQFEEATDWRAVFGTGVQSSAKSGSKQQVKIDLIIRVILYFLVGEPYKSTGIGVTGEGKGMEKMAGVGRYLK